jgi:5'-3' exonuclease
MNALRNVSLKAAITDVHPRVIGVDMSHLLYRSFATCAWQLAHGEPTVKWLERLVAWISTMAEEAPLVLVFDGDAPLEKLETQHERQERRQQAMANLQFAASSNWITRNKTAMKALAVTPQHVNQAIESLMQRVFASPITVMVSSSEADHLLVRLQRDRQIGIIIGNDYDYVLYQTKCLLNYRPDTMRGNIVVFNDKTDPRLRSWSLQNISDWLCMLGTDYSPGIPGIGPAKAAAILNDNGGNVAAALASIVAADAVSEILWLPQLLEKFVANASPAHQLEQRAQDLQWPQNEQYPIHSRSQLPMLDEDDDDENHEEQIEEYVADVIDNDDDDDDDDDVLTPSSRPSPAVAPSKRLASVATAEDVGEPGKQDDKRTFAIKTSLLFLQRQSGPFQTKATDGLRTAVARLHEIMLMTSAAFVYQTLAEFEAHMQAHQHSQAPVPLFNDIRVHNPVYDVMMTMTTRRSQHTKAVDNHSTLHGRQTIPFT